MIADLESLSDRFSSFVKRHSAAHWLHSFEREFHRAGEVVLRPGEPNSAAYVVISGRATEHDARGRLIGDLERGDLFGELGPLTNCPSTSTVTAQTDLDLMVLERDVLRVQLSRNDIAAEKMTELLAKRLAVSTLGTEPLSLPNAELLPLSSSAETDGAGVRPDSYQTSAHK